MPSRIESPQAPRPGRGRTAGNALLAATLASVLASACTPTTVRVSGGGAGPVLGAPVKLAPGSVRADLQVVGDASAILRESATDSLAAADMTCAGSDCSTIDLHARLLEPAAPFRGVSPPVRVVELVAGYRGPGASAPTSTVAYQRTVAVPGNLSTATWMRVSDALMNDLAADFSFRSTRRGIVVRLPSWASSPTSLPRTSDAKAFHVAVTGDGRSDDDTIGLVGEREVRLARRATDYLTEMLTDELRGAGHVIVPAKDGRLVGSQLEKFWIASSPSSGGWQTTAEIELSLEVAPPPGIKRKKGERHSCSASQKSAGAPGEPELSRLLQQCLASLAVSIRADSAWSLGAIPQPGA